MRRTTLHAIALCGAALVAFSNCEMAKTRYTNRLDGEWTIGHSERVRINDDGSTEVFEDLDDAGTLSVYEPEPSSVTLKEFRFVYTNYLGATLDVTSLLAVDDANRRVFMTGILSDGLYQSDLIWTVHRNTPLRQVWSAYGNSEQLFWPADRFDAGNDAYHVRWTITLERDSW